MLCVEGGPILKTHRVTWFFKKVLQENTLNQGKCCNWLYLQKPKLDRNAETVACNSECNIAAKIGGVSFTE